MTRLAVIIPCHNDGALAAEALASIREDEPVEAVIVDDGSTDAETLDRLDALRATGVRVVRRENGGLGPARNTGLEATSAALVYPLDADDLLEPGALGAMAGVLEDHPDAGFTWGDYAVFGDYRGRYRAPRRFLPWTLTYVNPYPVCSLFRRAVLERAGGWQRPWGYEDWDLWLRLIDLDVKGVCSDRVVYRRRIHGDGRMLVSARRRHKELYAELSRRNASLIARREELRRLESPAGWKRLLYPIVFGSRSVLPVRLEAFLQRSMLQFGGGLPGKVIGKPP